MNKLAIISVVYNNYEVLKDFTRSLANQKSNKFELFISDLSDEKKSININSFNTTIIQEKNKGFAFGVNQAIRKAIEKGYKYFCIINNDTFFKGDFVSNCLKSIKNNPVSIIGGKIYYAPNFEYHKKYKKSDKGKVIWYAGGYIDWKHALSVHYGVDKIDRGQYEELKEVDFITGALIFFDKDALDKIGFLDESYFLYFEDADYSIRAKNRKIKLYYDPSVIIWHKVSQSTGGSGSELHMRYQSINQLKFGLRYAPLRTKLHLLKNYLARLLKD